MWMFGGAGRSDSQAQSGAPGDANAANEQTVVFVSTFIVPPTMEEPFLGWWRMAKPFIATQPGFVSAKLLRSLDAREGAQYLNVAEWRGAVAYRDALSKLWSSGPPPLPGIEWRPRMYELVEETR